MAEYLEEPAELYALVSTCMEGWDIDDTTISLETNVLL
jgi:hypothetical protein